MSRTARLIRFSLLASSLAVLACQDWSDTAAPEVDEPALEGPSLDGNPQFQPGGPASANSATVGAWSAPFPWVDVGVHLTLLPDGRVLSFGRLNGGTPQVWDPGTGSFTAFASPSLLFCSGHTFLAGGPLLVAGGHILDGLGLPNTNIFDSKTGTWAVRGAMAEGRWYPTITQLANNEAVALGGTNQVGATVLVPEVFSPVTGSWRRLIGASAWMPYYPRTFLAPNGLIFYAGELQGTSYLNPSGNGSWTFVANRLVAGRDYGSAVMYEPGKVLYVGGGDPPTATAEVIDLNVTSPQWQFTGSMSVARRQISATLLPDGRVAVTGGTSSSGFTTMAGATRQVDVWDPVTGGWTVWASSTVPRGYHNTTVLLPDGRLLHTGSGDGAGIPDEINAEVFSPPYLFGGARPAVTSAPASLGYGKTANIGTPLPAQVSYASLVRLSSNTHSFDMGQRYQRLAVTRLASAVQIRLPTSKNRLPPGPYMLFLLSPGGVPSVARMVRVY